MSRVAFITTMKPPNHPTPSGDRTFARLLLAALSHSGHDVDALTALKTWRKTPEGLEDIEAEAETYLAQISDRWRAEEAPDAILTYHNYHKGPDLVGPRLAEAFGLPYAIVEPSRSPRRATGPWAVHFAHADHALRRANALAAVTRSDLPALTDFAADTVAPFPPFVDTAPFQDAAVRTADDDCHFATAAMLRPGRKADSIKVLAEAWPAVAAACPTARLTVAGDGDASGELEPLFPEGTFVGLLNQPELARLYRSANVFVWPAIEEPFGFAFLEAQAAGLPVIGGDTRGVPDVVSDASAILTPPTDTAQWSEAMIDLAKNPERRRAMSAAALSFAAKRDLAAGATSVDALLARAAQHYRDNAP